MAERIVSPGVFTRENDLSFLAQGVGEIGAAFIGPFKQGPAFVPTVVRTQSEFEEIFGTPDGTYYTEYAVQNYLREAGTATIVRVAGIGGYTQVAPLAIFASGSGVSNTRSDKRTLIGVLFGTTPVAQAQTGFASAVVTDSVAQSGSFSISGSGLLNNASILPSSPNDISDVFGESPYGSKAAYTYAYFEDSTTNFTGSASNEVVISGEDLPTQNFAFNASEARTPYVVSQAISGERFDLFRFVTLGHGTLYNTKIKIGISNVKAAGEDGSTDYSTFTITVRGYSDTDRRKTVLETFNNVNLDPSSPNYIAKRIGDRWNTIESNGKITENGDYSNKSKYVRVEVKLPGEFPISSAPFGHDPYTNPVYCNSSTLAETIPAVTYVTTSVNNTSSTPIFFSGFDFTTIDNKQYLKPIPQSAEFGANTAFAFDSQLTYQMTGSKTDDMVKRQFVLAFQYGFDGTNPIVKPAKAGEAGWDNSNTQGFDCSNASANGSLAYTKAINAISNSDEYDINLVVTPGIVRQLHPSITQKVIDMVEDRQDCFYIADFTDYNASITVATEQAAEVDSNYVGTYFPWVKTVDNNTNKLTTVPPSVLLPAVYAQNDRLAAEWFAPAGLNRGGIIGAVSVLNRLTHSERDTLYENKVNPIAAFPGQGIVAFGQKTLQDKASALDRINVRRLLINLKKFVASTSRFLVFEQNTATTRARFLNTVNPYLEAIQQRQGLYAFRVVMDETNNTPDVIDRNILAGQVFLQPAKTAEFIVIDFNILPTGASFSA
jgi:phage tail sheath protein FI